MATSKAIRPARLAPALVLLAVLVSLWRRWRQRRTSCKAVPQHWLLGKLVGNLPEILTSQCVNKHLEMFRKHHAELGCRSIVYRMPFKPEVIDTICPKNVEHMLKTHFSNYEKGSWFREPLTELLGDGIFNADGQLWHSQRKTASRMFSAQLFRDHIWHVVHKNSGKVRSILESAADTGAGVDVFKLMNRFTLDTIGEIGFGTDIGSLDDPSSPFLASFDHAQKACYFRFVLPPPVWKLLRFTGVFTEKGSLRHFRLLDDYSRKVVKELSARAKEDGNAGPSFVGLFLQDGVEKGERHSEKYLRDMVLNFLLAGRDTTAQALSWAIYCISGHPEVEQKIMQELHDVLGKQGEAEVDGPSYEQVSKLAYLQAVVQESLRLYPSVPCDSKVAIKDDTLPDGTFVPAGAVVQFNPYVMARDKELWGENAAEFWPDRWLEMKEPPSPYLYAVFNAGPRECLGKRLAYLEMKACLANFMLGVSLQPEIPRDEVLPSASLTIGMSSGLLCTARRRTSSRVKGA
mmetsp:Transcript_102457/g.181990  ORF Transcript_102457/g.181990 Transcript_102457/m.181990 type:complete len:517 (-) Transcript_102457:50-1600(-)